MEYVASLFIYNISINSLFPLLLSECKISTLSHDQRIPFYDQTKHYDNYTFSQASFCVPLSSIKKSARLSHISHFTPFTNEFVYHPTFLIN